MTLPTWPSGLPYGIDRDSWQITQMTGPGLRTDMNAGTTRQRRKFTMRVAIMKFVLPLPKADIPTFKSFFETTLGDGAARFVMSVWNGSAYVSRNCAFKIDEPPAYSQASGGVVRIGATLLVESL